MDKKQQKKDDQFAAPSDEIQAKITELMGLPIEEAAPSMSKEDAPNVIIKRIKANNSTSQNKHTEVAEQATEPRSSEVAPTNQIDSPETDNAVDDIAKSETDELLVQQDKQSKQFKIENKPKKGLLHFFAFFWGNKRLRNTVFGIIIFVAITTFLVPTSRYAVLNAAGVRASASFIIADKISGRPVKNVDVRLGEHAAKSAVDGTVVFSGLKLGARELEISKRSFEPVKTEVVIGWGSNPFEAPFEVIPTGTTFNFTIMDWLDDQPIKDAEVTDNESVAIADDQGLAQLTIEPTDDDLSIIISADGYRDETVTIPADSTEPQEVKLTASKPDIFISKRDGKYDLYKRDIDGKNETLVLPATGYETYETYTLAHPNDYNLAALVSTREGQRNKDGYLMSDLYIVNVSDKTASKLESTQSERIRIIGWSDDKLVFVKTISGPSASLGNRQRIIVYDYKKKEQKELASANYFTDARLINNELYYVVSSGARGSQGVGLGRIDLEGNNRRVLIGENIWALYRINEDTLVVSSDGQKWYSINISENKINQLDGSPPQVQDVKLFPSKSNVQVARVEMRDGKTELLIKNNDSNNEELILRQSGITLPIEWVNDKTLIFGVVTSDETARYVVSLNNKKAVKIGDNTASIYDGVLYY